MEPSVHTASKEVVGLLHFTGSMPPADNGADSPPQSLLPTTTAVVSVKLVREGVWGTLIQEPHGAQCRHATCLLSPLIWSILSTLPLNLDRYWPSTHCELMFVFAIFSHPSIHPSILPVVKQ